VAKLRLETLLPKGRQRRLEAVDLLPVERRFTTSLPAIHGSLFDGGNGQATLILTSGKADAAKITLDIKNATVKSSDGAAITLTNNTFDAGNFTLECSQTCPST
jgi:hypothetical protein